MGEADSVVETITTFPKYMGKTYWKIQEFNKLQHKNGRKIISGTFSAYKQDQNARSGTRDRFEGVNWWLCLYPRGVCDGDTDYASLYLHSEGDLIKDGLDVAYRICIGHGRDGTEIFDSGEPTYKFKSEDGQCNQGYLRAFSRAVTKSNKFILNGEMVITCTVRHTGNVVSTQTVAGDADSTAPLELVLDEGMSDARPLYRDGVLTDVELSVDGSQFKTHKLVLAAKSPVFRQMFTSNFKESTSNDNCTISIPDLTSEACKMMLDYMYGKRIPTDLSMEQAEGLLYASEKYQLQSLKQKAEAVLISKITIETVAQLLITSDRYNSASLKGKCHSYFEDHWKEVRERKDWDEIMLQVAHTMVKNAGAADEADTEVK